MCKTRSGIDAWANACLDHGLHVSGQDPDHLKYGRLIQLYVHEARGDTRAVEAIRAPNLTDSRKNREPC